MAWDVLLKEARQRMAPRPAPQLGERVKEGARRKMMKTAIEKKQGSSRGANLGGKAGAVLGRAARAVTDTAGSLLDDIVSTYQEVNEEFHRESELGTYTMFRNTITDFPGGKREYADGEFHVSLEQEGKEARYVIRDGRESIEITTNGVSGEQLEKILENYEQVLCDQLRECTRASSMNHSSETKLAGMTASVTLEYNGKTLTSHTQLKSCFGLKSATVKYERQIHE